jgi:hypothetical protein
MITSQTACEAKLHLTIGEKNAGDNRARNECLLSIVSSERSQRIGGE